MVLASSLWLVLWTLCFSAFAIALPRRDVKQNAVYFEANFDLSNQDPIEVGVLDLSVAQLQGSEYLASSSDAESERDVLAKSSAKKALDISGGSVKIGDKNVFIFSAEFHPWRLPVPKLWRDVLNKLKEAGFNTISIYTHWGLISPSPDAVDLTGINDLAAFLQVAKDVGLFVNVRLGPYINAETTAGGLPAWTQTLPAALRTNDTAFAQAWKPYIDALAKVITPYQVALNDQGDDLDHSSGPVILVQLENEYFENAKTGAYVQQLKDALVAGGVQRVDFSYNEASALDPKPSFTKIVDFFGVDSYPQGFNCKTPSRWSPAPTTYSEALDKINITVPHAMWEFQAGSFDPYDGAGYDKCYQLTNERFARVFDHALLAQNFKVLSHYMAYGGTNWGNLAETTVYTSYDYGAPITEDRQITKKAREYGLLAGFLRSSPLFSTAKLADKGINSNVTAQTADILVYHRQAESAHWYIVQQKDSTSNDLADFKLRIQVDNETLSIPQNGTIHLDGRDSKIISTNHVLPSGSRLLYSTAPMSFAGRIGDTDVVIVYGDAGKATYETVLEGTANVQHVEQSGDDVHITQQGRKVQLNWSASPDSASHALINFAQGKVLAILADTDYAYMTRPLSLAPAGSLSKVLVDGDVLLVNGGYHFANVTLDGSTAHLSGQSNASGTVGLLGAIPITQATFNGQELQSKGKSSYNASLFALPGPSEDAAKFEPPQLATWSYADSLPEIDPEFDDAKWTKADKTSTNNAYFYLPGISTDGLVLFSDEYGYHSGHIVWRGHFDVSDVDSVKGFNIRLQGGSFFGGSVWLNGVHLGSTAGSGKASDGNISATLPSGALKMSGNVLTVLHDSTGLEEWVGAKALGSGNLDNSPKVDTPKNAKYPLEGPKIPRGILSHSFETSSSSQISIKDWRIQGNYGGEKCPDKVRKCLNEGGLHAEVAGWHLGGYDTSSWNKTSSTSLTLSGAGVRYFTTNFTLGIPSDHDIPLSVIFPSETGSSATYRALLFVNGWQFGKRLAQFGPQTDFPIPPGVLDPRGENTLGVALWSLNGTATISEVKLKVNGRYLGGVDYEVNNPGYGALR